MSLVSTKNDADLNPYHKVVDGDPLILVPRDLKQSGSLSCARGS
jgi:hypothetical protein